MRTRNRKVIVSAAIAALGFTQFANAATYTWTPTAAGTSFNWINSGQDNWGTGSGGAYPNAPGDVANLNSDILGNQTIRLSAPITIGTLNIGDTGVTAFSFTINNASTTGTTTPANVLTFEAASPGGATALNIGSVGTVGNSITADVTLGGTSPLTISRTGTQTLTLSGILTTNNNLLSVGGAGTAQVTINGDILGDSTARIRQFGAGQLAIANNVKSFQGTYVSDLNAMTFITGSGRNAAAMEANGFWNNTGNLTGGSLVVGNNSPASTNPGQRLSNTAVNLNGGHLDNKGQAFSGAAVGQIASDTVATINFNSAYSMVSMGTGSSSGGTTMTATTLARGEGAIASVRAAALGTTQKFLVTNTLPANVLVGSGGASGTNTISIIPWMTANNTNAFSGSPSDFATYVSGSGFRAIGGTEYDSTITGTSDRNVGLSTAFTLAADQTVNSLRTTSGSTSNMGSGRVLTVTSGGVIFTSNNGAIGAPGNAGAGTLAFDSAEGVVWSISTNTNTLGAVVTGSNGFTKAGAGTLILAGANTFTGKTHVAGGTLQVGNGSFNSVLGDDDVVVHNGATLSLLSPNAILDDEELHLLANGLSNGKVNVGAGLIEVVGGLLLGSDLAAAGYYGSAAAAAANPSFTVAVNDTYFSGTGLIQVVPEPASLGLLVLGGLIGLRRRRA